MDSPLASYSRVAAHSLRAGATSTARLPGFQCFTPGGFTMNSCFSKMTSFYARFAFLSRDTILPSSKLATAYFCARSREEISFSCTLRPAFSRPRLLGNNTDSRVISTYWLAAAAGVAHGVTLRLGCRAARSRYPYASSSARFTLPPNADAARFSY